MNYHRWQWLDGTVENATITAASLVKYSVRRPALAFQNASTGHVPMAKPLILVLVGANALKPPIVPGIRCSIRNLANASVLLELMMIALVTLSLMMKLANAFAPKMLHQNAIDCRNSTKMIVFAGVLLYL